MLRWAMFALVPAAVVAAVAAAVGATAGTCAGDPSDDVCRPAAAAAVPLQMAPAMLQRRSDVQSKLWGEADAPSMTVLCWNVLYTNFNCCGGNSERRRQLADVIAQADIAGLQECLSEDEMQQALSGRLEKAPSTDKFNCIFYKPGVVGFSGISGRQYLGDDARDNYSERYFSYAKLSFAGRDFWLLSTHWCLDGPCAGSNGGVRHRRSAERMLQKRKELGAEGVPMIITADANSHMDGYDQDDGVQYLLKNGFEIAGKGPMAGGIDYIFVSIGDWKYSRTKVGVTDPSDHPSFSVQLSFNTKVSDVGASPEPPVLPEAPPICAPFEQWPSVDGGVTCGACKALVQSEAYGGRCDTYCESFGHVCLSAAEEVEENCAEKFPLACSQALTSTSDILCTCGLPKQAPTDAPAPTAPPTQAPTPAPTQAPTPAPTQAPTPAPTQAPTEAPGGEGDADKEGNVGQEEAACADFALWPSVDGGVTCSPCRALVLTEPYGGRCDRYCESFGHVCLGAAEEQEEDCNVKATYRCDESIPATSDMLCSCGLPPATSAPAPAPPTTHAPAPVPPTSPPSGEGSLGCRRSEQWPNLDRGTTCGSCSARVDGAPFGGRCDRYCESFGHTCVSASEGAPDGCQEQARRRCDEIISLTTGILCTCAAAEVPTVAPQPVAATTPAPTRVPKPPQPPSQPSGEQAPPEGGPSADMPPPQGVGEALTCASFDRWPDVDAGVTCGNCTALVLTAPHMNRCDKYCASFGHVCVAAAEEADETCEVLYHSMCEAEIDVTSDMLCTCRLPGPPAEPPTEPTERPTELPAVTTPAPPLDCCQPFRLWPDVDGVTCGGCRALVQTAPYGGRCDKYCESFGHVCTAAAEEASDDCTVKYTMECDVAITDTSDMLCTCKLPSSVGVCPAPEPTTTPPATTTAATPPPPPPPSGGPPGGAARIEVRGRQLLVDGRPIHLKGVAWNPVKKGGRHPDGLDFLGTVARDAELMAQAGINAVRTYSTITDRRVLDALWARGIWVVNGLYSYGGTPASSVVGKVNAVKDHPSILMWTIGNEWNYNGLYVGMSFWDSVARLKEAAALIKQNDRSRPLGCIFGELAGLQDAADKMPDVDIWGVNAYRGISLGDLFDRYSGLTSKPLFMGEYGADAWNAKQNREDVDSQARATKALAQEIATHSSVTGGVCIGGFVFEFNDEWWKDGDGDASRHDIGGDAPGGGPYPDATFNEEWWGLVDIDRNPRPALRALAEVGTPGLATA